ncbi:MAG: hypothetical protein GY851_29655 [bacterium]|nr:hypothetical protein [bacterium]
MRLAICMGLVCAAACGAGAEQGIAITPDENGAFVFEEDFTTPRFLEDAFLDNLGADQWREGAVTNMGPGRNRTITYRFHGEAAITSLDVSIAQRSNARSLGGRTTLLASTNGLDWSPVDRSTDKEADANHFQTAPLILNGKTAEPFGGGREVWVRVVMDNYSGLKTAESSALYCVKVALTTAPDASDSGSDTSLETRWADLKAASNWRTVSMEWCEGVTESAPHYLEDVDGWLLPASDLSPPEAECGLPISRKYSTADRRCLSMAVFVNTDDSAQPIMARITFRARRDSHRESSVLWDNQPVATFDAASYFDQDRAVYVDLPGSRAAGVHELRLTGRDGNRSAWIRRVEVCGPGVIGWAEKPPLPQGGPLRLVSAYYMPDPPPPADSQVVEGRQPKKRGVSFAGLQRMYAEHSEFGALRIVVVNDGPKPVRIADPVLLNGQPVEDSYVDFKTSAWDAPGVVWYRVRPRTLAPGQAGQVYIRFRRRPSGDAAKVTLTCENAPACEAVVPYTAPAAVIDYVTTGKTDDTLFIYARVSPEQSGTKLAGVTLDGVPLPDARIYGADFPGGLALAVAKLPRPLEQGAYHVAGIDLGDDGTVAAQFRVLPFMFARSSIHVPTEVARDMHMNLLTWVRRPLEACQEYDIDTTAHHGDVMNLHERMPIIFAPDEPDAKDNRGGGYDKGLGWHVRTLAESGWQELVERSDHPVASWMNMDGTVRPLNWAVYGQYGDVNGFDPYPVTYYGGDHAFVRESLSHCRNLGAPTRLYAILEAYGWSRGQGVPSKVRGPIPAEYRQNVVQAIGTGMKGLSSWVYSAIAGGWQLNDPLRDEITASNRLLESIEDLLLIGTPIDCVECDAGTVRTGVIDNEQWPKDRVWAGALLCGPDALVVTVANHIPAQSPEPPDIEPARDLRVRVALPSYMGEAVTAWEATPDGLSPVPSQLSAGRITIPVEVLESGKVYVLRAQSE